MELVICEECNQSCLKLYGIAQDPETKNYMMVLDYASCGSLHNYLDTNKNYSWKDKIVS